MERNNITRRLIAGILGTVVCFGLLYWVSDTPFIEALCVSLAINFIIVMTNYIAVKRFNKDNKR